MRPFPDGGMRGLKFKQTNPILEKGTKVYVKLTKRTAYLPTDHQDRSGTSDWLRSISSFMVMKCFYRSVFLRSNQFSFTNKTLQGIAKAVRYHSLPVLSQPLM